MSWSTERLSFRFGAVYQLRGWVVYQLRGWVVYQLRGWLVYQLRGWTSCIPWDERRRGPVLNAIDTPPTARLQASAESLYDYAVLG